MKVLLCSIIQNIDFIAKYNQIYKFIFVGTIGFIVDACILELILRTLNVGLFFGRLISFSIAVIITWQLNRKFVFKQIKQPKDIKAVIYEFCKYILASSVSMSMNICIYMISAYSFALCSKYPSLAVAIGSLCAMLITFLISKYWVFK